ncbi:uncharacterized protein A1O5_12047 [Cladophialophora psammophila CBS 110553]|uniref:DUF6536 domain-containing protein n=1 Tax=Cladophialophora psammophila CBS 110553 TaxID=1182543 RepID=W9W8C9_9EURO|nr:uncharacterized protein A1O5_12047 [Cladophialophora psammophila CBS 110553]EXJ61255.1 hypothetical protein A1O5_12047 [Cladophialophora psammophila CBS 110553]
MRSNRQRSPWQESWSRQLVTSSAASTIQQEYMGRQFWDYRYTLLTDDKSKVNRKQRIQIRPSLKTGYKLCLYNAGSIFVVTFIVGVWVVASHNVGDGLVVTLFTGDCSTVRGANFWIHLLINIPASSLFAESSYMMQRLAALTREDIDRAHAVGKARR